MGGVFWEAFLRLLLLAKFRRRHLQKGRSTLVYPVLPELKTEAPGEFVEINGISTHYMLRGEGNSGPLIVLVHGWSSEAADLTNLVNELSQGNNTVLAYDYYGHGYTDGVSFNVDRFALVGHLAQLLIKLAPRTRGLTLKPFTLVGFSMGGPISALFALEYPSLVRNLVLMNPAGIKVPIPIEGRIVKIPVLGDLLFEMLGAMLLSMQIDKGYYHGRAMDVSVRRRKANAIKMRAKFHPGHVRCILSALRYFEPLVDFDRGFAALQTQSFPVMVLLGENDVVCNATVSAKRLKELLPRAEFHMLSECGHEDVLEMHSRKVASRISKFASAGIA
eukprot:jgi/Bigna1/86129/estExt_fgenesh1_pg.C_80144